MKKILARSKTYGNKFIYVDDEDYELVKQYTWSIDTGTNTFYATSKIDGKKVSMHRFILKPSRKKMVDHINRNGLDNRRSNLRLANQYQNGANTKKPKNKKGKYRGVYFFNGKYVARIKYKGKRMFLGRYKLARDAAKAYNDAALKYFKEFAVLNKI